MINVIWQTENVGKPVLSDETVGQLEYIAKIVLKYVDHVNYFDNKQYKTFLDNSIIVYSAPLHGIDPGLKVYLEKYNSMKLKYILFHLSNESLGHNFYYYDKACHVFRFHYDSRIVDKKFTTLPLGFTTGFMNQENNLNLSKDRDILTTFIGQSKADRQVLIDIISGLDNKFLYLTKTWNCPTRMSIDEVIDVYKRTRFIPCPMGNISPETLRLYEALEWGCVPITKRYRGIDYYERIFGKHPLPLINEWSEIKGLMDSFNDETLDSLILSINKWYKNLLESVSERVGDICSKMKQS